MIHNKNPFNGQRRKQQGSVNRSIGLEAETRAASLLNKAGYKILAKNYHCKVGEIDIIAEHNASLVFVEVKFRHNNQYGSSTEMVTQSKQRKLSLTAQRYLQDNPKYQNHQCRFDVLAFHANNPQPEWIHNAFEAC